MACMFVTISLLHMHIVKICDVYTHVAWVSKQSEVLPWPVA